jgi:hypothetical protein
MSRTDTPRARNVHHRTRHTRKLRTGSRQVFLTQKTYSRAFVQVAVIVALQRLRIDDATRAKLWKLS